MTDLNKNQSSKREKTMLIALLLSGPGPILTGIAAITSHSATQIADFLRRTAELVALFVSWWIYRKLQLSMASDDTYRANMERMANLTVAGAMMCSGIAMIVVGVVRLFIYSTSGNVIMGLIIAVLGLLTNTWFWWRYGRMTREELDPIIAGQQKLYRAKACVDLCVVTALTSVVVAPNHPATQYIDALGCIIVAFYLLYNGVDMIRKNKIKENFASEDI
jgi:divalent metal cation (Fe/Co/Zn/Cd) transporter